MLLIQDHTHILLEVYNTLSFPKIWYEIVTKLKTVLNNGFV
jgi:hypothetical protein